MKQESFSRAKAAEQILQSRIVTADDKHKRAYEAASDTLLNKVKAETQINGNYVAFRYSASSFVEEMTKQLPAFREAIKAAKDEYEKECDAANTAFANEIAKL